MQCFNVLLLFHYFFCSLCCLRQNSMLMFLPLTLLVFCGPAGSTGSVCFCLFLFWFLCLLSNNSQHLSGLLLVALCLALVTFFLAGLLFFLLAWHFLAVCHPWQTWSPGPLWALQCPFRGPAHTILTHCLHPSSPFMCIHAPPILCGCLLLVWMCVFGHIHILLGRAHVCFPTHKAHKCVR